eukprot:9913258-Lingulodinium_polyedra.AAC.1
MDNLWTIYGQAMDSQWAAHGHSIDWAWTVHGPWTIRVLPMDLYMDCQWVGLSMDIPCIVPGQCMDCPFIMDRPWTI